MFIYNMITPCCLNKISDKDCKDFICDKGCRHVRRQQEMSFYNRSHILHILNTGLNCLQSKTNQFEFNLSPRLINVLIFFEQLR